MAPRFPQRREQIPANWLMMFSRFLRPSHPIPWHLHPHKDITRYRETRGDTLRHPLDCVNNNIINNFLIICQCRVVRFIWIRQRFTHSHKTKSSSSSSAASIWNYIIMRATPTASHLISPCGQSVSHSLTHCLMMRTRILRWLNFCVGGFFLHHHHVKVFVQSSPLTVPPPFPRTNHPLLPCTSVWATFSE